VSYKWGEKNHSVDEKGGVGEGWVRKREPMRVAHRTTTTVKGDKFVLKNGKKRGTRRRKRWGEFRNPRRKGGKTLWVTEENLQSQCGNLDLTKVTGTLDQGGKRVKRKNGSETKLKPVKEDGKKTNAWEDGAGTITLSRHGMSGS